MIFYIAVVTSVVIAVVIAVVTYPIWCILDVLKSMSLDNIHNDIEKASDEFIRISEQMKHNDYNKELAESTVDASTERWINAYENGCRKYYGHMVSKKQFREMYEISIIQLDEAFHDKIHNGVYFYLPKFIKSIQKENSK